MAKGPTPTDQDVILGYITYHDGARLDVITEGCSLGRSTASRLIRKLADEGKIQRLGYVWFAIATVNKICGKVAV